MVLSRRILGSATGAGSFVDEMAIPDPRTYDIESDAPAGVLYNPITNPGNGLYARVMKSTPGMMQWWRLGKTFASWGAAASNPPFWANSAGCTSLWSPEGATLTTGLLSSDADGAASLTTSQYLEGFDYRVQTGNEEILTAECWVNLTNLGTDTALCGEWKSNDGWLLWTGAGDLRLYVGSTYIEAEDVLSLNTTHHVVGVIGGTQAPTPDYYSRIYVDGEEVVNGLITGDPNNNTTRFQINQYADGAGAGPFAGVIDEVAIFNRMLQPDEVTQHYQAGLGVLWP